jgi:MoxR-like ATPase
MGYPEHEDAVKILKGNASNPLSKVEKVIDIEEMVALRKQSNDMFIRDEIYEYIVTLVEETRRNQMFSQGASPRGTIAILNMAKAIAIIDGRDFVTAEDVQDVVRDTLGHRVKLGQKARAQGMNMAMAMKELIRTVRPPRS